MISEAHLFRFCIGVNFNVGLSGFLTIQIVQFNFGARQLCAYFLYLAG